MSRSVLARWRAASGTSSRPTTTATPTTLDGSSPPTTRSTSKDNPRWVGANHLGHIIDDMAKYRHTPANGYAVGFWSFLERLIYLAVSQNDPYEIADYYAQRYAAIKAAREQEVDHA